MLPRLGQDRIGGRGPPTYMDGDGLGGRSQVSELVGQLFLGPRFELSGPLAADAQLAAQRSERSRFVAQDSFLHDEPLSVIQHRQGPLETAVNSTLAALTAHYRILGL